MAAHEVDDGYTQWYVNDAVIECDAEEFWRVVAKALMPAVVTGRPYHHVTLTTGEDAWCGCERGQDHSDRTPGQP